MHIIFGEGQKSYLNEFFFLQKICNVTLTPGFELEEKSRLATKFCAPCIAIVYRPGLDVDFHRVELPSRERNSNNRQ